MLATVHDSPFNIRVFHKEAKSLSNVGYDVSIISQHKGRETVDRIKIIPIPKPKNRFHRMTVIAFLALYKAMQERPDVYHLHSPEQLPIGIILKFLTNKKVVYDVHEDFPKDFLTKEWIPNLFRKPISIAFKIFQNLISNFLDYIIAATPSISKNFPQSKTTVVNNYPFMELTNLIKQNYDRKEDKYSLIFAGDLSEERGIYELIQSLEFVDQRLNVRLILIGRICNKNFEKRIKELKTFSKVELIPWVPFSKVVEYYEKSDIGVVVYLPRPNHMEAMPNKLFEFMAAGLPVIASNFLLWKKIVEDNQCGITVNPSNPRDIARGINYLLLNPDQKKKMGINGRLAVIEKYNWEKEREKLIRVYDILLPR